MGRVLWMVIGLLLLCNSVYAEDYIKEGLISYWNFDEGSGNIANDSVGKNTGLIAGAAWVEGKRLKGEGNFSIYPCSPTTIETMVF